MKNFLKTLFDNYVWEGCPDFPLIILQNYYSGPNSSGSLKVDIFMVFLSVLSRCVITKLFTEGNSPFDLSQLLSYQSGEYSKVV